ncbi:hypothetical protein BDQ12DRAFT_687845, partial [Crucibulum laeve]
LYSLFLFSQQGPPTYPLTHRFSAPITTSTTPTLMRHSLSQWYLDHQPSSPQHHCQLYIG